MMFTRHDVLRAAGILSGLSASLLLAAAASAQEPPVFVYGDPARTERVRYADIDLDTVTGRTRLHHRVGAAVDRVCDREIGRDGLQLPGFHACASSAWNAAAPQIALAMERSKEMALTGQSSVAATAITVSAAR